MIKDALRLIRVFHNLKQGDLARELGISQSYLSEVEGGTKQPTLELLAKYGEVFSMPVSSILYFSEKKGDRSGDHLSDTIASKALQMLSWARYVATLPAMNAAPSIRERYLITQSPLFKMKSRRKLAELLDVQLSELENLANAGVSNYSFWDDKPKPGKKVRHIEHPHPPLRKIQRSLTRLLGRIEPPSYLHSGYRGRSYITNAAPHQYSQGSAKIDIKNFFPAAANKGASEIARAFREQFLCSLDVAAVLTKLTTILGHIPTGGNSSTMVELFWAYKLSRNDEIHNMSVAAGVEMTCCVDDMTFTGAKATPGFINDVRLIVRRFGLKDP